MSREPRTGGFEEFSPSKPMQNARSPRPRGRPRRLPADQPADQYPFSAAEVEATVACLFCQGVPIAKIRDRAREQFHVHLSREEPWRILSRIAARGHLQYVPGFSEEVARQIQTRYPWLRDCRVVETSNIADVAIAGARYLLRLLQRHCQSRPKTQEFHVGYAGGRCLRQVAREFARLLSQPEPIPHLPEKIVFHSIVAGFNDENPETDPNFFYPYFVTPTIQVKSTEHVTLYAPGLVREEQIEMLNDFTLIQEAMKKRYLIDVILTSAGHWKDEHSTLQTLLRRDKKSINRLSAAGTVGDMCWQPMGPDGPIDLKKIKPVLRAMVLLQLSELHEFIDRGTQVLLVLGPCGKCNKPKTTILRSILDADPSLITHLVVDSRTARGLMLKAEDAEEAEVGPKA
jgi:DNA-binding transcriptional regulator LsrR (DeoR family)